MNNKWLETHWEGTFFSNQELIDSPEYAPEGWFNPFTEPEKLKQQRLELDMKPREWRQYCFDNYPGLDATGQFRIRKEEAGNKYGLERVSKCREVYMEVDGNRGELVLRRRPPCKEYSLCPSCNQYAKDKRTKELLELIGQVKIIEVSIEDEKKIARQLKAKYGSVERVPIGTDKTTFLIRTDDDIGESLSFEHCEPLACHSIELKGRRVTGSVSLPQETQEEEPEPKKKEKITQERIAIEFNSEIKKAPMNITQLNNMVQKEVVIIRQPETKQELQSAISQLENKAKEICKKTGLSYKTLDKTIKYYDLDDLNWQWVRNKLLKAQSG